jgi:hypothetical protein
LRELTQRQQTRPSNLGRVQRTSWWIHPSPGGAMRARIIFRGLTLFTFDKPTAGAKPMSNLGTLTAWLISDPRHSKHPLHKHTPKIGWIQKDDVTTKHLITAKKIEVGLVGQGAAAGVIVEPSFLDYVPRLRALYEDDPNAKPDVNIAKTLAQSDFVTTRIVIPSGRIYSGDFISWHFHGNTPANVAYMGTRFQGFGANEVIVEIGDDTEVAGASLQIKEDDKARQLRPYTKADRFKDKNGDSVEDVEPNVVEVVITNTTARRSAVFWGLHSWSLFAAARYAPLPSHRIQDQYDAFVAVATGSDRYRAEWTADLEMMTMGGDPFWPFPFLTDIKLQLGENDATGPGRLTGKLPEPGHNPLNSQVCPFGHA